MKKKLVLMTSALMAIGLLAGCGNQHTHDWGEVVYTWSEDNKTCTAERVCKGDESHEETETVDAVPTEIKKATCTEDGSYNYTATFTKEAFQVQTKENVVIKVLEHDYQFDSFVWEGFNAQAKFVCSHDASHVQLHDATVTNEVTTQPGCETKGVRTYTATYDGHTDTKTDEVAATGHSLVAHAAKAATCTEAGNSAYWSCEDCDKFFSDENGEHEIAADSWIIAAKGHQMTHHDAIPSDTCTSIGNIEYWSCSECDKYFSDENGNTEIEKDSIKVQADHVWNDPTYEWNEDHTKCTAKHVCQNDESHVETEEVDATEGELESTDCWLYGLVAKFTKAGFESQIYDYYKFTLNDDNASYSIVKGNHLPANVVIPNEINKMPVTKIGYRGFYSTDITSIVVSKNIVVIENYGISYSHELISIDFEEGSKLERIEDRGIVVNYSLKSINNLPASLTYIGDLYFNDECTSITYLGTMEQWRAIEKKADWNEETPACSEIHCSDGDVDDHWVDSDPPPWEDDLG